MSKDYTPESPDFETAGYLTEQIITYIGNKRALLDFIGKAVCDVQSELGKEKMDIADLFSGSGIVSRYMKRFANNLWSNDLEGYCETINRCYLANMDDVDLTELNGHYLRVKKILETEPLRSGFISELYSPVDDSDIKRGERVFFTSRNAKYIDTARQLIGEVPEPYRTYLLAPLLYEASVHNNTSGVFKGFYKNSGTGIGQYGGDGKNALSRIMSDIEIRLPIFSNYSCNVHVMREDANALARVLPLVDLAYIDPPYNQHPYGSNYFMLNLINDYERPEDISRVSGIPTDWNKSQFNKKQKSAESLRELCENIDAKYLLISFSDDGFISREEMSDMLSPLGKLRVMGRQYNTFRGSRNLSGRDTHIKEFLYLLRKS